MHLLATAVYYTSSLYVYIIISTPQFGVADILAVVRLLVTRGSGLSPYGNPRITHHHKIKCNILYTYMHTVQYGCTWGGGEAVSSCRCPVSMCMYIRGICTARSFILLLLLYTHVYTCRRDASY